MRLRTLLLLCVPFLAASAFAAWFFFGGASDQPDPLELERQRFRALIAEAEPAAEQADPAARTRLAKLLLAAPPPVGDAERARTLLRKAAEAGYVEAQYQLGRLHAEGIGVPRDHYRAAEWLDLAANLGRHAEAQFLLGDMYFHGRGVPHDYGEALELYRKAAHQGHPVAQYLLGVMHEEGWGMRRNLVDAYTWLTLAQAKRDVVMAYDPKFDPQVARERLIARMTEDQRRRAEQAASAWTPRR